MRRFSWTPSIVPNDNDETVYLVADDFGRLGRVWREVEGSLAALPSEHATESFPDDELSKRRAARKIS